MRKLTYDHDKQHTVKFQYLRYKKETYWIKFFIFIFIC
jgi:hypothetical protein